MENLNFVYILIFVILFVIISNLFKNKAIRIIGNIIVATWFLISSIYFGWKLFCIGIFLLFLDIFYITLNVDIIIKCEINNKTKIFYIISSILMVLIPFLGVGFADNPVSYTMYGFLVLDDNKTLSIIFEIIDYALMITSVIFLFYGKMNLLESKSDDKKK